MIARICLVCKKPFFVHPYKIKEGKGKYCSRKCCDSVKERVTRFDTKCVNCGKKFKVRKKEKRKFCSRKCYVEYSKKEKESKLNVICDFCGKQFHKKPHCLKELNFCSKECWYNFKSESETEEIICDNCGKKIRIPLSRYKQGGRFCSKKCYGEYKSKENTIVSLCDNCKKRIAVSRSEWKAYRHHFCSEECSKEYNKTKRVYKKRINRKILTKDDHALIPLNQNKFAIIDIDDIDKVKNYTWNIVGNDYVRTAKSIKGKRITMLLHRYIMGLKKGDNVDIDHINRNSLDCRKANMRLCNKGENRRNSIGKKDSTSEYKGLSKVELSNETKWAVQINGFYVGRYKDEKEAAIAADILSRHFYQDFAYLNFPELKKKSFKELLENNITENKQKILNIVNM
ncbi:HNH endonuclease [Candidatus Woesearchaeota archaeon]|nr:HNH endonuclease [Candidatus Woesearchaeota archaeon]